jgi:hypothetical protein
MVVHGRWSTYRHLTQLIQHHSPNPVPYRKIRSELVAIQEDFLNWVVFNLNYSSKTAARNHLFERTLVAQRRGLSREGREIMAAQGCLMKRTLYDNMLKNYFKEMVAAQRYQLSPLLSPFTSVRFHVFALFCKLSVWSD